ncbi:hypothetical protein H6788_01930 [Candidatus Nomurabacteria bacterium]|nr:hypothetical protein [Candidatus Nomurabacteria bacterium]MCB9819195.1 hypothetical protein [Candidatus Nomurabacteria bacterium]
MTNANIVSVSVNEIWDRVRARLKATIGPEKYNSWFTSAQLEETHSNGVTATVSVATPFLVNWINNTYHSVIQELWQEYQPETKVRVVLRKRTNGEKIFDPEAPDNNKRKATSVPKDRTRKSPTSKGKATTKPASGKLSKIPSPDSSALEEAKLMVLYRLTSTEGVIKVELCRAFVIRAYGVDYDKLVSDCVKWSVTIPRHIAIYLAKKLTPRSLAEIGGLFGGRDHTTVVNSIKRIETLCVRNPEFNDLISSYIDHFEACVELSKRSIVEAP